MSEVTPLEQWPDRLEAALCGRATRLHRVTVLAETSSTQDAARRLKAPVGTAVVAARQTAGRGRLGRSWADTGDAGIAVTVVLGVERPERLALVTAVGVAGAAESQLPAGARVGIKWPNDITAHGRKLSGILIEQVDHQALVGIGVNVNQVSWPPALADRAISLRQLRADRGDGAAELDRAAVIEAVLLHLDAALRLQNQMLAESFRQRDELLGEVVQFATGAAGRVTGRVVEIDPLRGLAVEPLQSPGSPIWLPAAHTSVIGSV